MNPTIYALLMIAVISVITAAIRFLPFALFAKKTPAFIVFLGKYLPYAIIGMLVVYCLKDISFVGSSHGIPEIIAVASVVILHKLRHNTLLSVLGGTIVYMLLIRFAG